MIPNGAYDDWKKSKSVFKSKKTIKIPEEERDFFPNSHEPLIDEETFELAQKRIATRTRPIKDNEIDLFSGLLFCADCGYKLYFNKGAGTPERKYAYTCGTIAIVPEMIQFVLLTILEKLC